MSTVQLGRNKSVIEATASSEETGETHRFVVEVSKTNLQMAVNSPTHAQQLAHFVAQLAYAEVNRLCEEARTTSEEVRSVGY